MQLLSKLILVTTVFLGNIVPAHAEDYFVESQQAYAAAAKKVSAGDVIILANGEWRDFEIVLTGKGEKGKPITLTSEEAGKVVITGKSNLRIGGQYILVTGLVFKNGYSPTSEVISFQRSKEDLASNSRVTQVVIDNFSKPNRYESDYWVGMYGKNNRFDHNYLVGKSNQGVTVAVRLDTEESQKNYHRIDHNYFGPRPVLGSNGGETIRVGTSQYAETDSYTTIDNNYFERCDGEIEIISIKSGRNIVRENVFHESRGALTLRHGDNNLVERNIFFGKGKDHTGGVRVINRGQTVRANYMEGLRGTGFASALTVMNGVPNSPANRYVQVSDALIENNTVVDTALIELAAGSDAERSATPTDSRFANNLIAAAGEDIVIKAQDDISGITFAGNILAFGRSAQPIAGIEMRAIPMKRAENGLLYPEDNVLTVGAPRDLKPVSRDAVGPNWYAKPDNASRFGRGEKIIVLPGEDTLPEAFATARSGDTLMLQPGEYRVDRTMVVDKAVTVAAAGKSGKPVTIRFSRPALFEIFEGGNLRLDGVQISGADAPDSVGNAVIRTSIYPMLANFEIELHDVRVKDLNINNSFNVIALGKGSFADKIEIVASEFVNISGSVIQAVGENDDYGRYNAEYVKIHNSSFADIGEEIVALYRGGTDESTFGPHMWLGGSRIAKSGKSKKNKTGASFFLHGVQDTRIIHNVFADSAPIVIQHSAGEPATCVAQNSFADTPEMKLKELVYQGAFRLQENCMWPAKDAAT